MQASLRLPLACLGIVVIVCAWSAINPHDMPTWWLEASPAIGAAILLIVTYKAFPLTRLLYILITVHCIILLIGAHYTYAEVPFFNWLRDAWELERNHYDRLGHFAQGFIPAMIARELLIRTSPLKAGKWLFAVITLGVLGISAAYELIEWVLSDYILDQSDAFLGTQGDIWDTQKDMVMALLGAILAQLSLYRIHNRQLKELN